MWPEVRLCISGHQFTHVHVENFQLNLFLFFLVCLEIFLFKKNFFIESKDLAYITALYQYSFSVTQKCINKII